MKKTIIFAYFILKSKSKYGIIKKNLQGGLGFMYYVKKRIEISASHKLSLNYESKCENLHGHNWIVEIYMKSETLDENGMVYDFTHIKEKVKSKLDHQNLNDILNGINPTAENIAKWIKEQLGEKCYKVMVQESEGNIAVYEVE